jgi:hypothetical protein
VRADGSNARVGEDGRSNASLPALLGTTSQHVTHGIDADMAEVDKHTCRANCQLGSQFNFAIASITQAVHLENQLLARLRNTAMVWLGCPKFTVDSDSSSVSVLVMTVPSKGCVTHAERVVETQGGQGVSNLMQALDGERRDEFAVGKGMLSLFGTSRQSEVVRVLHRQSLEEVNLLQGCFDRPSIVLVREVETVIWARNECGPESAALLALLQTWDI